MASLSELDLNEIGEWPGGLKIITILLLCAVLWGAGYYFFIKDKRVELAGLEQKEETLKSEFELKQSRAVNLDAYKEQLEEIKLVFGTMLQQLPGKSEVADLLLDISRSGLTNGLEFELFKPEGEQPREFYAELPIRMQVTGEYHQFGGFVSDVAALPRIVTLHDLTVEKDTNNTRNQEENVENMKMTITAKTYRYFDEEELEALAAEKAAAEAGTQ